MTLSQYNPLDVALFGGSFDPPHCGHVELARYVLDHTPVQKLLIVPVFDPPHKSDRELTPFDHRMEMVRLAFGELVQSQRVVVSDIEEKLEKPSYTWHTLRYLQQENPSWNLRLVIGQDMYDSFESWMNYRDILEKFSLVVLTRSDGEGQKLRREGRHLFLDNPLWQISSTRLREDISHWYQSGEPELEEKLQKFVPRETLKYIEQHQLYK